VAQFVRRARSGWFCEGGGGWLAGGAPVRRRDRAPQRTLAPARAAHWSADGRLPPP